MHCQGPHPEEEQTFLGLGVGPGVAIGVAHLHDTGKVDIPEYRVAPTRWTPNAGGSPMRWPGQPASQPVAKKARNLPGRPARNSGYLLDAYQQMLKGSRLVRGVDRRISEERINAEAAVQQEINQIVQGFAAMDDAYLAARIEDIRDVGRRLVRNLTKTPYKPFPAAQERGHPG